MSARYTGGLVYNPPGGWSGYFDGSGDYLSVASNAAFGYGTGDFTIEFWVYPTSSAGTQVYLDQRAGSVTSAVPTIYTVSGTIYYYVSGSNRITGGTVAANQWSHISICRSGSSTKLFINGTQSGSTFTDTTTYITAPVRIGEGNDGAGAYPYSGYLSNFRIVKGTALYTATFTLPTGALQPISGTSLLTCAYSTFRDGGTNNFTITVTGNTAVNTANPFPTSQSPNPALGGAGNGIYTMSQYAALLGAGTWPAYDPYYENVTLNLHGNAGAVLPFNTDASTNNFQVTQVGNTSPSNYTPFITNGYWSNLFGSNSGLTAPNNSAFKPATNAFTVECWIFSTATGQQVIYGDSDSATNNGVLDLYLTASGFLASDYWTSSAGVTTRTSTLAPIINQWNHVLVSRTGTTMYIGLNGVLQSFTAPSSYQSPATIYPTVGRLGAYAAGVGFTGYISNFRYINGTNLYSGSTYTVPTAPLTAVANTVLLTCQSNRFVDNSTNAFALTVNGSPSVNPLQPFTAPTGTSAYGSGYFDGSGDYLTSPNVAFASNNFTIEGWFYPTTIANLTNFWGMDNGSGSTPKMIMYINSSGNLTLDMGNAGTTQFPVSASASTYLTANAWNHIAVVRSGTGASQFVLYINGTNVSSGQLGTNISSITAAFNIGYIGEAYGQTFSGYISNFRTVNGTAVYTGNFTPSTTPLTAVTNTSLLTVQTNAPSQNNTFLDSSTNNFTVTRYGNTTQGTLSPYGNNWSNYFDGSSAKVTLSSSAAMNLDAQFTIECWVYWNGTSLYYQNFVGSNDTFTSNASFFRVWGTSAPVNANKIGIGNPTHDGSSSVFSTNNLVANKWNHVAATRDSSNIIRVFINGTLEKTGSTDSSVYNFGQGGTCIGDSPWDGAQGWYSGYISNLRIIKGSCLYTSSFTPSTTPLTAVTNTSLLVCQSNRFIDNSTNAFTLTVSGSPSVQRFSPFSPTTAYSTSVIGGSGYFDGSGDYLSVPSSSAFQFGSGDFTIECWAYMTGAAQQFFFAQWNSPNRSWGLLVRNSGTTLSFVYSTTGSNETSIDGTIAAQAGRWAHFAAVRNGNTLTTYMNGVSVASASMSGVTLYSASQAVEIGRNPEATTTWNLNGYATDVRVVKGTAVYTTAFTPPTAPLTAITNTSLLLSYTNAGILDNAMMNDLETVGNAQISTSVKKYGTGSMYFDGTGDYLFRPSSPLYDFGTGDFTLEMWVYRNGSQTAYAGLVGFSVDSGNGLILGFGNADNKLRVVWNNAQTILASTAMTNTTWTHVALVRSGATVTCYQDGTSVGTSNISTSAMPFTGAGMVIGRLVTNTDNYYFNGYIDDLRITKGVARYTASFTPPTSQVQDQ